MHVTQYASPVRYDIWFGGGSTPFTGVRKLVYEFSTLDNTFYGGIGIFLARFGTINVGLESLRVIAVFALAVQYKQHR